jgi:hypothetical protein
MRAIMVNAKLKAYPTARCDIDAARFILQK